MREDSICLFPPAPDPFVGLFLIAKEGGTQRLVSFFDLFSERVHSELRVDGSGYVIPCAIDSSYHIEDINPSLIRVLCDEDVFQDFFVQEYGRADFGGRFRPVPIHRGCPPSPVDMSRGDVSWFPRNK